MRIAVMQPYFVPYAGYWRLLAASDVFVLYDCVQFPRRGWVHRNRLMNRQGELDWLTLPLRPAPFEARIDQLMFADDARERLADRARAFPILTPPSPVVAEVLQAAPFEGALVDYLEAQICAVASLLGLGARLARSSSLGVPERFRGQDRILEICRRFGADAYVNAPGGLELYDRAAFAEAGVSLHFLPPYQGGFESVLQRLAEEGAVELAADIRRQTPDFR